MGQTSSAAPSTELSSTGKGKRGKTQDLVDTSKYTGLRWSPSNGQVLSVKHATLWDEHFADQLGCSADLLPGQTLAELIGYRCYQVLRLLLIDLGLKEFTVYLRSDPGEGTEAVGSEAVVQKQLRQKTTAPSGQKFAPAAQRRCCEFVAFVENIESDGCCSVPDSVLWLIPTHLVGCEKKLSRTKYLQLAPTIYFCPRCECYSCPIAQTCSPPDEVKNDLLEHPSPQSKPKPEKKSFTSATEKQSSSFQSILRTLVRAKHRLLHNVIHSQCYACNVKFGSALGTALPSGSTGAGTERDSTVSCHSDSVGYADTDRSAQESGSGSSLGTARDHPSRSAKENANLTAPDASPGHARGNVRRSDESEETLFTLSPRAAVHRATHSNPHPPSGRTASTSLLDREEEEEPQYFSAQRQRERRGDTAVIMIHEDPTSPSGGSSNSLSSRRRAGDPDPAPSLGRQGDLASSTLQGGRQTRLVAAVITGDAATQSHFKKILNTCGIAVSCFDDAKKAFSFLAETPVGLVICDVLLPGLSGSEVMKTVRSRYPTVGILGIAGSNMFSELALSAGAAVFVLKSASAIEVKRAVYSLMSKASTTGSGMKSYP
jgi:CheY-like chemotaxis protein